jgi:uncharacterized protein
MTPQERQMLADLFERIRSTSTGPRDPEAEAFIGEAVRAVPSAPYVLAQTTIVQQHALEAATQRIAELEARAAQPQEQTSFLGNLGKTLFGGAPSAPQPGLAPRGYDASAYQRGGPDPYAGRQPTGYAPPPQQQQQPGPWGAPPAQGGGGGFLANAMTTAAGVAGGVVLANSLESLLGGRGGLFGGRSGGSLGGGETINNIYESGSDPAGQHAEDVLQDMDQDQDDEQDAADDSGSDSNDYDT